MIANQGLEALTVGQSGRLYGTSVDIRTGSLGGARAGVRYNPAFGSSGPMFVQLDNVRYRQNGTGTNLTYILYDPDNGPANWDVANFDVGGATAGAPDRKSVVWGKWVSVRFDAGGRRAIKKKKVRCK